MKHQKAKDTQDFQTTSGFNQKTGMRLQRIIIFWHAICMYYFELKKNNKKMNTFITFISEPIVLFVISMIIYGFAFFIMAKINDLFEGKNKLVIKAGIMLIALAFLTLIFGLDTLIPYYFS